MCSREVDSKKYVHRYCDKHDKGILIDVEESKLEGLRMKAVHRLVAFSVWLWVMLSNDANNSSFRDSINLYYFYRQRARETIFQYEMIGFKEDCETHATHLRTTLFSRYPIIFSEASWSTSALRNKKSPQSRGWAKTSSSSDLWAHCPLLFRVWKRYLCMLHWAL